MSMSVDSPETEISPTHAMLDLALSEQDLESTSHSFIHSHSPHSFSPNYQNPPDLYAVPGSDDSSGAFPSVENTSSFDGASNTLPVDGDNLLDEEEKTARVLLRKQIHRKTVVRDGLEETVVTEETQVVQDNDGPEELRQSVKEVIDRFMETSEEVELSGAYPQ
jgi:hypothetical protein